MIKYSKFFKTPLKFKNIMGNPLKPRTNYADNMAGKWLGNKRSPFKLTGPSNKPNPAAANKTWPMK